MSQKLNRRGFMTLAEGAGALLASSCVSNKHATDAVVPGRGSDAVLPKHHANTVVPKRALGKTGVMVSQLCFGGASVQGMHGRALLDEALAVGLDCWEATSFTGRTFGDYFATHPGTREKVFLTAKVKSTDPSVMQQQLDSVLRENGTSLIDFLAVHVVRDVAVLTDDVRRWAEKARQERKIRFFGFCTHKNMDRCLTGAAQLGWIDGIQTFYNYRMQSVQSMEDALQSCREAGIGIFVVKSMGFGVQERTGSLELSTDAGELSARLSRENLSFHQAKLKAIWRNPSVTSICSLMPTVEILRSNASAAMDEHPLGAELSKLLADHANTTGRSFCRRCGVCDTVSPDKIPISDIMEALMYLRGYGNRRLAAMAFAQVPIQIRNKIAYADYSIAEERCPQRMPIARLMKEADRELGG